MKFILFIFINICLVCLSFGADQQYEVCRKHRVCGKQSIEYPFYIGQQQGAFYCGYPGFELGCINDSLVLNISADPYIVDQISYTNYSLHLSSAFSLAGDFCSLPKIRNLTFPVDHRFELNSSSSLVLLSNCSIIDQGLSDYKIGCDQDKSHSDSVLAMNLNDPNISLGIQACKSVVVAPVADHNVKYDNKLELLRNGFVLNWRAGNCTDCHLSGGYCGYDSLSDLFKCFCSDRPHSRSCKPTEANNSKPACLNSFRCQNLRKVTFPFYNNYTDQRCGLFKLKCNETVPKLQLQKAGQLYDVNGLNQSSDEILIHDHALQGLLDKKDCDYFTGLSFLNSHSISFTFDNITLFKCPEKQNFYFQNYTKHKCKNFRLYYRFPTHNSTGIPDYLQHDCSVMYLPLSVLGRKGEKAHELFELLSANFTLRFHVSSQCSNCHSSGGQCVETNENYCVNAKEKRTTSRLILGTAIPGACLVIFLSAFFIFWRHKRLNLHMLCLERDTSSDIEEGASRFGIPVFSYKELEEATHNFDTSKELGDGGFGTVYHGKLKDGRDVAVKRCYENSYRRVEQFMNEIKILTHLRHRNLVLLYGSTSHRSRDLLLVYEYVPNGTVADHIHGDKSKSEPLMWPIRMNIAIETASALCYLHKSDIIHRDVKTNNILLDNSFCVKVADFGLSRLFPTDVTHVSTAPQGTPGYVDPEYHQCYQLTDKSDVYSFGVVLIELISSLPAVDISRQKSEINLANLAIERIQRCALDELIDPALGQDDSTVRMATSVAELAFRCLQLDKDLRPTMDEVLESLEQIQGMKSVLPPPSPETEDAVLLKEKLRDSPVAVIDKWISTSTTPSTSR